LNFRAAGFIGSFDLHQYLFGNNGQLKTERVIYPSGELFHFSFSSQLSLSEPASIFAANVEDSIAVAYDFCTYREARCKNREPP
jgi:hypothetical protein